jgi:hypothetical protein
MMAYDFSWIQKYNWTLFNLFKMLLTCIHALSERVNRLESSVHHEKQLMSSLTVEALRLTLNCDGQVFSTHSLQIF